MQLNGLVQRDLTRVLLLAPVDIHAVQALELLAVYAPFEFSHAEIPTGTALLAVARRIATALRLAEAPAAVMRLRGANERDRDALDEVLRHATIYYSLRAWELSFAFNDPQLPNLPQELEELDPDDVMSAESSPPRDLLFRVVGRIAIAHRLRSLRKIYDWSRGIYAAAMTGSLHEILSKISKVLGVMFSEADAHQRQRSFAFGMLNADNYATPRLNLLNAIGPYLEDQNVALISEWIEMETRSGHMNVLGHGLSHAFRPKHLFLSNKQLSALDLLSHVATTPPMMPFLNEWGHRLLDIAERLLAGFVGMEQHKPFPDGHLHTSLSNGSTFHAHGAPPMTTCAIVLSATTSITENHAALFMKWGKFSERVESYLVIMRQAAKCLAAMDPARSTAMGSIPAASAQSVNTMASAVTNWLRIIRNEQSSHASSASVIEDSTNSPPVSSRGEGLCSSTASSILDSAPNATWEWPIQSPNSSFHGDVPAQDTVAQHIHSGSSRASNRSFDGLLDVDTGSFDWTMFNTHSMEYSPNNLAI